MVSVTTDCLFTIHLDRIQLIELLAQDLTLDIRLTTAIPFLILVETLLLRVFKLTVG